MPIQYEYPYKRWILSVRREFKAYYWTIEITVINNEFSIYLKDIFQMFNFGSNLGNARNGQYLSLNDLLNIPNVSLMRCLDYQTFLSEFRSPPPQLREYMTYHRWSQLVELVTLVGDPYDKKRSYKFPLTAADLLSSENAFVFDKLLPQEGCIVEEQKTVESVQHQVEQQVQDDEDQDNNQAEQGKEKNEVEEKREENVESAQDEQFGEFIEAPVRKKKIVKVKEVVDTVITVKKQYPPLVSKILDYFNNQINYTLTSYCCKVLTSLLNKRTSKFLTFFFSTYSHSNYSIFKHIGSRSVVELLTRIFSIQTKENLESRIIMFKKLIQESGQPHQLQILSNISATLCQTFDKLNTHFKTNNPCKELQAYYNLIPELLPIAVQNIIGEHENVSVYSAPFLFQLLNSLPQELDNQSIDKALCGFVEGALKKLQLTIQSRKSRIGVGRVKLVEVFNFILKRNQVRETLSKTVKLFPILFSLIKAYPLNNILHNQAFKLITNLVSTETSQKHAGDALISWLKEEAQAEKLRVQNGALRRSKGYHGHLFNLLKSLKETNNQVLKDFTLSLSYFDIMRLLAEKETFSHERNLGGFATRKVNKFAIFFSKEEILTHHAKFLSSAKPATFEADLDDPFQNLKELQELQRQLDGVQLDEPKPQEVIQEQKHKAELIEQNAQHLSAFWKVHLDYSIDSLMEELY